MARNEAKLSPELEKLSSHFLLALENLRADLDRISFLSEARRLVLAHTRGIYEQCRLEVSGESASVPDGVSPSQTQAQGAPVAGMLGPARPFRQQALFAPIGRSKLQKDSG